MSELIVALDDHDLNRVCALMDRLGSSVGFYKVGLELFTAAGPEALRACRERGKRVFLDLKLHDIPQTVARTVEVAAHWGVALMTLHAAGGRAMIGAAREAAERAGERRPRLLAVTVLTSLDADDLASMGVARDVPTQVEALAWLAGEAGADGVVCSALEAARLRQRLGPSALIVTPGIRAADGDVADQKRVATPESAVRAGATHLVVGRPITAAPDPVAAARAFLEAIAESSRTGIAKP